MLIVYEDSRCVQRVSGDRTNDYGPAPASTAGGLHEVMATLHASVLGSHTAVGPGQPLPFGYVQFAG